MNKNRRDWLKASSSLTVLGLATAAGLIKPRCGFAMTAWNKKAFESKSLSELMKVFGSSMPLQSTEITLIAPDIAENGAAVSVDMESKIKKTTEMALLVANNPAVLAAHFMIPLDTKPKFNMRVKMSQTSEVYVLVKAGGKYYFSKKEVKVTLGGCVS